MLMRFAQAHCHANNILNEVINIDFSQLCQASKKNYFCKKNKSEFILLYF